MENNLKPFDLEAAKAGAPVVTRDGRPARIICFDAKSLNNIIALVEDGGSEEPISVTPDGEYSPCFGPSNNDLFMVTVKREGWVNMYKTGCASGDDILVHRAGNIFKTYEAAKDTATRECDTYIGTFRVEWEE